MSSPKIERSEQVNSLAKGLAVLKAFGTRSGPMTISEIAAQTELTPASARRMLLTLDSLGYLKQVGKRFTIAAKVLDLGHAYLASMPLWQVVQPVLEQVSTEFNVSASASVLEGTDILYVVRAPHRRISPLFVSTGTRQPVQVTAMGRVMLAALDEDELAQVLGRINWRPITANSVTCPEQLRPILEQVRRDNFAIVDQEYEFGLIAIAVPIRNIQGQVVAAINAASSTWTHDLGYLRDKVLPAMFRGAAEVRSSLTA